MYDILFAEHALKQLNKLQKQVQGRVLAALERIRIRPEAHVKKLVGDPGYRLRVWDYRIIMDIDRSRLSIMVLAVGHRKNVYGR